jgi:predicted RNA binding protein YcfA (HicA-like mRNA interferase family)
MAGEVAFRRIRVLLESNGWRLVRISGSHHIFEKPGQSPLSIPVHHNRVKPAYVRRINKIIEADPA